MPKKICECICPQSKLNVKFVEIFNDIINVECFIQVHKRMHVGACVKMHGCKECDHFFVDVSSFYNHMKRKHGEINCVKNFQFEDK